MVVPTDALTADGRALTTELLELRGQPIILTPVSAPVETPGGGHDYTSAAPRSPQMFAMFNTKGFDGREDSTTDRGLSRKFQFEMVGAHDAKIAIGDIWEDDVAKYTVETVDRTKSYLVQAIVVGYLKGLGHGAG